MSPPHTHRRRRAYLDDIRSLQDLLFSLNRLPPLFQLLTLVWMLNMNTETYEIGRLSLLLACRSSFESYKIPCWIELEDLRPAFVIRSDKNHR